MPVRSLQHADLSPKAATDVGNRLVELASQAEKGQVVRVHIVVGGRRGGTTWTPRRVRATRRNRRSVEQHSGLGHRPLA
jgi:hypothetical protein